MFLDQEKRTEIKRKTLSPVWNQKFVFDIKDVRRIQDLPIEMKVIKKKGKEEKKGKRREKREREEKREKRKEKREKRKEKREKRIKNMFLILKMFDVFKISLLK